MTFLLRLLRWPALLFILPAIIHLGIWAFKDKPSSWRNADWSSAGVLPKPAAVNQDIYVLAARTGGLKGAFATHSWIVTKTKGESHYNRYDVVGWGKPVRKNAYPPDGRWFSNAPRIHFHIDGDEAGKMIGRLETAIANYKWRARGDYTLWPGPNSNTFVANIMRSVPQLKTAMPATAIGRDYPSPGKWIEKTESGSWRASLAGYAGIVIGAEEGFEINFLGLVAGFNISRREIKIPAFGTFSFSEFI